MAFIVLGNELVMNLTAQSLRDELLGRVFLTDISERCLLNQRIARFTPIALSPRFWLWLFKSPTFRRFVEAGLNTGTLIQHMFTSQVDRFVFPLPPADESVALVTEVERMIDSRNRVVARLLGMGATLSMLCQGSPSSSMPCGVNWYPKIQTTSQPAYCWNVFGPSERMQMRSRRRDAGSGRPRADEKATA
jgi:hypothetical protein